MQASDEQEKELARKTKELDRQKKEQDKIAKKVAADAAKKQKAELRATKKLEASKNFTKNPKKLNPKLAV